VTETLSELPFTMVEKDESRAAKRAAAVRTLTGILRSLRAPSAFAPFGEKMAQLRRNIKLLLYVRQGV
jgi:hypothetical protein